MISLIMNVRTVKLILDTNIISNRISYRVNMIILVCNNIVYHADVHLAHNVFTDSLNLYRHLLATLALHVHECMIGHC